MLMRREVRSAAACPESSVIVAPLTGADVRTRCHGVFSVFPCKLLGAGCESVRSTSTRCSIAIPCNSPAVGCSVNSVPFPHVSTVRYSGGNIMGISESVSP